MHIGVDVGGTNTDAVLLSGHRVLASIKSPTTDDIGQGIVSAIRSILSSSGVDVSEIECVMIGTTQFTNAFVEGKKLVPVATIRACLPATESLAPMVDFPEHLASPIGRNSYLIKGGYEFDGREISQLDEHGVISAIHDIKRRGISSIALSCVFSPMNDKMEKRVAELIIKEAPDIRLTLSSQLGRVGLIERENATIMNASLTNLAETVINAFRSALRELNINCPFYVSQNDGTLMSADYAERYPVLTFASGPTNSIRGAAFLSGVKDGIVVDIGGTTSDVGVLRDGFPRETTTSVDIGGVRTNFRMPDVIAIGLGGGSIVRESSGKITIGPDSVALNLLKEALVFGGSTLTATDIAVAAGYAEVGDKSLVAHLDKSMVHAAVELMHVMVEEAVDKMKSIKGDVPVILVGGGSILLNRKLKGASAVVKPELSGTANAIGAGLAQVGGEVDKIYSYAETGREIALGSAKQEAIKRAVEAGADHSTTKIVSIEELPLAYLPAGAVRIRAKAIGDLATKEY